MEDLKGSLTAIRDMARARVKQLEEGASVYSPAEKAHYLKMYQEKLREVDRLLQNVPRNNPSPSDEEPDNGLKKYWRRLFQ